VTFERNTVHAITEILESPAIFFTVDAPRRVPTDVVYVNPDDQEIRPFVTHLEATKGQRAAAGNQPDKLPFPASERPV
jgi:hypothetical protein